MRMTVKLAGVFTFHFLIVLYSACLIFCASSESVAMGSCSYSCTIDHLTGNWLANFFFSFVAIDVRLADRSSVLPLNIWCWHSSMAKEVSVLKSNWSLLPCPFMLCPPVLLFFHRRFHVFVHLSLHTLNFFVEIVEHQI